MTFAMSRLSAMMFLQFFIWGAWFVTLGTYLVQGPLKASASQVATAFLSQSIGAIVAPFLVGLIADRYFAAQRILAVLHLAGAVLMWFASTATSFDAFAAYVMAYMLLFMPTLALANSVAMRHMQSPEKQFPPVRVAGSIGWVVAGVPAGVVAVARVGSFARPLRFSIRSRTFRYSVRASERSLRSFTLR